MQEISNIAIQLGLGGGAVAGIVIAILVVVTVLTLLGILIGYKYLKKSNYR